MITLGIFIDFSISLLGANSELAYRLSIAAPAKPLVGDVIGSLAEESDASIHEKEVYTARMKGLEAP
jgi:hypothetical protein